jgi:hypothetical protein
VSVATRSFSFATEGVNVLMASVSLVFVANKRANSSRSTSASC